MKFNQNQWDDLVEAIWECYAGEICAGLQRTISHVICSITWDNPTAEAGKSRWKQLEEICMDNDLFHAIKDTINILQTNKNLPNIQRRCYIFDPITKIKKYFCRGRVGIKDIPKDGAQLISMNVRMALYMDASGNFKHRNRFETTKMLDVIGNKITNEHILALEGKLHTLAGIPNEWTNAPLPIPLDYDYDEDEKMKLVPFVVTRKL